MRGYVLQLVGAYAAGLAAPSGAAAPVAAVDLEYRTWFNETNESRYAIVPGVIVMVMSCLITLSKE